MKKAKPVSNLDVLQEICDQLCMDIITTISNGVTNSDNLRQVLDLPRKQYYSRCCRLLNLGLISRKKKGEFTLTSFGRLVYKAQLKIATGFSHPSELRMIDAIKFQSGISDDEQKRLIDKLLDDSELKNLVAWT
jgi:hypothetical protein